MKKISIVFFVFFACSSFGQHQKQLSSSAIYQQIKKLNVLGNVLYLAAHPDDENTRFIAYCANEKLYNTAYLSLTRGDGGQNLIGTEIREELGIIRTQELLAARKTDGGQQFFSRANDFGYSKTPEETLEIWDKNKILSDVVWVIRKFKPDVIVCRFPTDGGGKHGHHTASALLGVEAFEKAADKTQFPEQLNHIEPWQAKRIVVNTGKWWNPNISTNDKGVVAEDIGVFSPLLGTSYNELAAKSRSMHKSQGFGSIGTRGEHLEYFEHLKGEEANQSLFDGIDASWGRIKETKNITNIINTIIKQYNIQQPYQSIDLLITLKKELKKIDDNFWKSKKIEEVNELIKQCAGLFIEANAHDFWATNGDSVKVNFELIARNQNGFTVKSIQSTSTNWNKSFNDTLTKNQKINLKHHFQLPYNIKASQPYWLEQKGTLGTYNVSNQLTIGKPENDPSISYNIVLDYKGEELTYNIPLIYKWKDPVKGELTRPFVVVPPVFINISEETLVFSALKQKEISLTIKSTTNNFSGILTLKAPEGWKLSENQFSIKLTQKGEEQIFKVIINPTNNAVSGKLIAQISNSGNSFNKALKTISYGHIPTQIYMPTSSAKLVFVNIKKQGDKIGYLSGAGDKIPESLRSIGYTVDELTEKDVTLENIKQYDAIVLGIRVVNVNHRIGFIMPKLLKYCEEGGTLVLQYNTAHRLKTDKFSPYPLTLSRDRVTEEDAKVDFLQPNHKVLNTPNKITAQDFDSWIQERGLYFPNKWDEQYDAILSCNDKGENPKKGSLLVAKYGKGHYVYTGISFFRELPAGVPGAYRLFINLISLGNE